MSRFPGLPIAITEHGYWHASYPLTDDLKRQRYVLGSLTHLQRVVEGGVEARAAWLPGSTERPNPHTDVSR